MWPCAGHAAIASVRIFEKWLERCHCVLTFWLTQVLSGHGSFWKFLFRIRRDDTPGCHHCVDRPEDTVENIARGSTAVSSWRRSAAALQSEQDQDHVDGALSSTRVSRRYPHKLMELDTGATVCQGRGNRLNEMPRTWQLGQLNDQAGFLVRRSLKLPSAPPWTEAVIL